MKNPLKMIKILRRKNIYLCYSLTRGGGWAFPDEFVTLKEREPFLTETKEHRTVGFRLFWRIT